MNTNSRGILLACLLSLGLWSCNSAKKANQPIKEIPQAPPNIIMFMVDDMGWQDTSVPFWNKRTPFNDLYQTPNMERLAKQGLKFTQAYASAVCSPTRVSLMTGMNAARHKVTNWTLHKDKMQPMETNHPKLRFPLWNINGLSPVDGDGKAVYATCLPKILKDAGYYTVHSGKAHFGAIGTPGANPKNIGFDVNIGGHAAGGPGSYLGTENFGNKKEESIWGVPGLEEYYGKDIFLTEALTLEAKKAMDTAVNKKQPFFLYMSHYAVHVPFKEDKRFSQKYKNQGLDATEVKYAAMVEGMDKSLGDIMDYLEEKHITDNTIILFMSDNGGISAVARGGTPNTHNKPLASGKGSAYEGGIREPMLVKWPGITKAKTTTDARLIIEDFFPTLLEMAGISDYKTAQHIDGKSFVPIIKGEKYDDKERALFWHYPNEWGVSGPGIGPTSTIRKGDWKLIYYHLDSHFELFNIVDDIGEVTNLVSNEKTRLKTLAKELGNYLRSVNAQMPTLKKTNQLVLWPDDENVLKRL